MMNRTPVAGHISSLRAAKKEKEKEKEIKTTIKDASKKHIDPRTGLVQEGPSEMGPSGKPQSNKNSAQYYNVDSKNQNGHGENGNGYGNDDESHTVSGKLDIKIKENNSNKSPQEKISHEEPKSSTPPPKVEGKPPKSKKTSGIRRVFSLGSSSSKNSNSETTENAPKDDLISNSNSTAPKTPEEPKEQKNHTQTQESNRRSNSPAQIQTTHYLVEDSAYGSMDLTKKW